MTRAEQTDKRDLAFSRWIRESLPDSSSGFSASDIDFVLWNWAPGKEAMMLVEVKTRGKSLSTGQKLQWRRMDRWLSIASMIDSTFRYLGYYVVTFEGTDFNDGTVWIQDINSDEKRTVSEADLRKLLSLD